MMHLAAVGALALVASASAQNMCDSEAIRCSNGCGGDALVDTFACQMIGEGALMSECHCASQQRGVVAQAEGEGVGGIALPDLLDALLAPLMTMGAFPGPGMMPPQQLAVPRTGMLLASPSFFGPRLMPLESDDGELVWAALEDVDPEMEMGPCGGVDEVEEFGMPLDDGELMADIEMMMVDQMMTEEQQDPRQMEGMPLMSIEEQFDEANDWYDDLALAQELYEELYDAYYEDQLVDAYAEEYIAQMEEKHTLEQEEPVQVHVVALLGFACAVIFFTLSIFTLCCVCCSPRSADESEDEPTAEVIHVTTVNVTTPLMAEEVETLEPLPHEDKIWAGLTSMTTVDVVTPTHP